MSIAAVFLDRDGVLNEPPIRDGKPESPRGLDDLVVLPGVPESCTELHVAGYALVVVTNQPEIARGTLTREAVDAINGELAAALPVAEIVVCPHDERDGCTCRKPKPGMLFDAAGRHSIDLQRSYLVGDRWRDIEAGQAAGVRTVFVDRGYDERRPEAPDAIVSDLTGATAWILADSGKTRR
jgi:D-glycero-D-manno-heptose 1,7-bisphosphate phosphatase